MYPDFPAWQELPEILRTSLSGKVFGISKNQTILMCPNLKILFTMYSVLVADVQSTLKEKLVIYT